MKIAYLSQVRDLLWSYPEKLSSLRISTGNLFFLLVAIPVFVLNYIVLTRYTDAVQDGHGRNVPVEAVVGVFTNTYPVGNTTNQVDRDVYARVFDKLFEVDYKGNITSRVFASFRRDDDLRYTFVLNTGLTWHDGEPVSIDDIEYTISRQQDSGLQTTRLDDHTLQITLPQKNPAIYELLSVYLIPKHIMENTDSAYIREKPLVGTGDFVIKQWDQQSGTISLVPRRPDLGTAHVLAYYADRDKVNIAAANGMIDIVSLPRSAHMDKIGGVHIRQKNNFRILSREKTIFINQNRIPTLEVRQALQYALDKDALLAKADISGVPIDTTYPQDSPAFSSEATIYKYDPAKANSLLEAAGLKKDIGGFYMREKSNEILTFTIVYLDNPENNALVDALAQQYEDIGILIQKRPVSKNSLINEYIATRNYDLLLLEIEVSADYDRYAFWHSDNLNYPHSNFAQYQYKRVDILLANARQEYDVKKRLADYQRFHKYLSRDSVAIYLYNPIFTSSYLTDAPHEEDSEGGKLSTIATPEERYRHLFLK